MNLQTLAPCPQRSTASFTLSWGAVCIPLSAYSGTEEVRIARKEFVGDDPVGRAVTNKTTGEVIDRADIVKRAESTSGVWVELDDDEIALATQEKGLATVETFVLTKDLGQYVTEGLYQVRPRRVKGKTDPAGNRALVLFLDALKTRKAVALVLSLIHI